MRCALLLACGVMLVGCVKDLDRSALMDPESCKECHQRQFDDWSSSMHAYAADDPVFIAMNARGQRETGGALGDFCVNCHAPMAVREGATTDGLNLDEVPQHLKGVTCFFCHSTSEVGEDHNNSLVLADDGVLRGGIRDPIDTPAHHSAYSPLHDRTDPASSNLCGSCHDVVLDNGLRLESTFVEWKASLYARDDLGAPLSCGSCHMSVSRGQAAEVEGAPERRIHLHSVPGVDLAMIDWPGKARQRAEVEAALFSTLSPEVCVEQTPAGADVQVTFENVSAGHSFPSGATQDRRAWVEVTGFSGEAEVFSSGLIAEGTPVEDVDDPNLWRLYETILDEEGEGAHMFWEAASTTGELLPAPATSNLADPDYFDPHVSRSYFFATALPVDRVRVRVHIRAIGLDVLDSLIESGDLDARFRDEMPTLSLGGAEIEWTPELGTRCNPPVR